MTSALPLLEALRDGLPHRRIDLAAPAAALAVVGGHFVIDTPIALDGRWRSGNPMASAALWRRLRSARYDLVIDLGMGAAHLPSALLVRATGAQTRIGRAGEDAEFHYTHVVTPGADAALLAPLSLALPTDRSS